MGSHAELCHRHGESLHMGPILHRIRKSGIVKRRPRVGNRIWDEQGEATRRCVTLHIACGNYNTPSTWYRSELAWKEGQYKQNESVNRH